MILESYDPGLARHRGRTRRRRSSPPTSSSAGSRSGPGAHAVELVYRPPGLVAGLVVSALSIARRVVLAWRTSRAAPREREALP